MLALALQQKASPCPRRAFPVNIFLQRGSNRASVTPSQSTDGAADQALLRACVDGVPGAWRRPGQGPTRQQRQATAMKQSRHPDQWPHPLITSNDGIGPVVRKVVRRLETGCDDEASAFIRMQVALLRRRTTRRFVVFSAAAATVAAAVAALWLTVSDPSGLGAGRPLGPRTVVSVASVASVATNTIPAPAPAPVIPRLPAPPEPPTPPARVIRLAARPVPAYRTNRVARRGDRDHP